jgi:hypothetical protein
MKKNLLLLSLLFSFQIHAQTIGAIYSIPANPTTADDIYILVDCQFNSGGCSAHTQGHGFITADTIGAWALHCLGPLAVICNYTDTFHIGMLPAGNYVFAFHIDEGFGGPPCTPGFNPGPNDWYSFTVSLPTSEKEIEENAFIIYPNPAERELKIKNAGLKIEMVKVSNILGEEVFRQKPIANDQQQIAVDVSGLLPGMYVIELKTGEKLSRKIFSVQR